MFWKRVFVRDYERVLVTRSDLCTKILSAGEHRLINLPGRKVQLHRFDVREIVFRSRWAKCLVESRSDLVEQHFVHVRTSDVQVAMIYADGRLLKVLTPAKRVLLWREVAKITTEFVTILDDSEQSSSGLEDLLDDLIHLKTPAGVK